MQNIDKQQVKREISDWGFLNKYLILIKAAFIWSKYKVIFLLLLQMLQNIISI